MRNKQIIRSSLSSYGNDQMNQLVLALGYRVLSIKAAARFAGVSVSHMHRAAKGELQGTIRLKVFRVGRRVLTRTDWLDEWMHSDPAKDSSRDDSQTVVA